MAFFMPGIGEKQLQLPERSVRYLMREYVYRIMANNFDILNIAAVGVVD